MKLYVWDQSNADVFQNYYGESMAIVVANSEKEAWLILSQKFPRAYIALQEPILSDYTKDGHPLYPAFQEWSNTCRNAHEVAKQNAARQKFEQLEAEYYLNQITSENGRGDKAPAPQIFDLNSSENLAFYSAASD